MSDLDLVANIYGKGHTRWLVIGLFLAINGCVLWNGLRHDPYIGYDAHQHIKYATLLAGGRLPELGQTHEFFSPPLPYVLPAALLASGLTDERGAAKAFQMVNVVLSVALTLLVLRICEQLSPGDTRLKLAALLCLGMLPVYYKTFSQARGEPLVAAVAALAVHETLAVMAFQHRRPLRLVSVAVAVGFLPLCRQWGLLVLPAIALFGVMLWLRQRLSFLTLVKLGSVLLLAVLLLSGWFYLHLKLRYGVFTAFPRDRAATFSLSNQPRSFYTSLGKGRLFSSPVRPAFRNQLIPIFYSDVWGDYWCYFLVQGRRANGELVAGTELQKLLRRKRLPAGVETNASRMARYLGRVNLVSLYASGLFAAGVGAGLASLLVWGKGARREDQTAVSALLALTILTTVLGYLWFVIMFPHAGKGDTIKATYLIQIYPLAAVLTAQLLANLRQRSVRLYRLACSALVATTLHNLPTFFTRFVV